jgi:MmyB-like transcription regulator ligand binding domain
MSCSPSRLRFPPLRPRRARRTRPSWWSREARSESSLPPARAKITPERAGLTSYGPRRVPGLRREEVAVLAGVSVPYLHPDRARRAQRRLRQRARSTRPRSGTLDEAERAHLFDLARSVRPTSPPRRRRARKRDVRPSIQHILDGLTGAAAFVHNARLDNLATNELARALYSDMFSRSTAPGPVNSARYVFLDPRARARDFYIDWDRAASDVVAILRSAAGRDPYDRELSDLVGELSTQSEEFRTRLGRPQRPLPRHRHQEIPSPGRRRANPHLQPHGALRRPRSRDHDLHRRTRDQIGGRGQPPRKLGRYIRSTRSSAAHIAT